MKFQSKPPSEFTLGEIYQLSQLINSGGAVHTVGLQIVTQAQQIATCTYDNKTIGVGAIKKPKAEYIQKVFKNAGLEQDFSSFYYEIGWLSVDPIFRGQQISATLNHMLLDQLHGPIFATTVARQWPNPLVLHFRFRQRGNPWPSEISPAKIELLVRT